MPRNDLKKGALRDLFIELDAIEKYIADKRYRYPIGSSIFSSSIPTDIDTKEGIVDYFESELGKLNIISAKLENWFEEYKKRDISRPDLAAFYRREDFRNLSAKELHLTFMPINRNTGKPFDIKSIRNMINSTSMVEIVVRSSSELYSPIDFENYLIQSNRSYDKEISDSILEYLNNVADGITPNAMEFQMTLIRRNIKDRREREELEKEEAKKKK